METIRTMDRRRFLYGIRLTVTNESIDVLGRSIEFLQRHVLSYFSGRTGFRSWTRPTRRHCPHPQQRFAAAFLEAYDIAVSYGRHLYYSGARPWVLHLAVFVSSGAGVSDDA